MHLKMKNVIAGISLLSGLLIAGGCQDSPRVETSAVAESSSTARNTADSAASIARPRVPRSADAMPDFVLTDLDGNTVHLSDFEGKAVLVNFWATWCPPCRQELPDLVDIQSEFGGERFTVLGVSLDQTGPSTVRRFAQEMNLNFPLLMGNQEVVTQYGNFRGIPTSFLLNQRHEQVKRYMGMVTKNQLSGDLNSLFDEAV